VSSLTVESGTEQAETPVPGEIRRLLESRCFEKTPALRKLLIYLWEHRDEEINEYSIATEALDRRPDFDPRTDAAVRVQVARLRQRLGDFYSSEGAGEQSRISVPHGDYQIQVLGMDVQYETPLVPDHGDVADSSHSEGRRVDVGWRPLLAIIFSLVAAFVLGSVCVRFWYSRYDSTAGRSKSPAIPALWQTALGPTKTTRIVIPTPVFFTWIDKAGNTLMVRDPAVNGFSDFGSSPRLAEIGKNNGAPTLAQDYTASSDTRASFQLARFLVPLGAQVNMSNSSDLPPEALENENLVLMGTIGTLTPFRKYIDRLHFQVPEHMQYVVDTQPTSATNRKFEVIHESATRTVWPGIVALIPGSAPNTSILIIEGYHTGALVSFLTTGDGAVEVEKAIAKHGQNPYFEAVVLSEVDGVNPLRSWIVDYLPYKGR
jgi:hypothetical protein